MYEAFSKKNQFLEDVNTHIIIIDNIKSIEMDITRNNTSTLTHYDDNINPPFEALKKGIFEINNLPQNFIF